MPLSQTGGIVIRRRNRTKHSRTRAVISAPAAITKRVPLATYAVNGDFHGCLDLPPTALCWMSRDLTPRAIVCGVFCEAVNRRKKNKTLAKLRWLRQNFAIITVAVVQSRYPVACRKHWCNKAKAGRYDNLKYGADKDGNELCNWLRIDAAVA